MNFGFQPGSMEKAKMINIRKVYCYYCQKEGDYSSQCPVKSNEKHDHPQLHQQGLEDTN